MNVAEYTLTELEKGLVGLELNFRQTPVCITCIHKSLYVIEGLAEEGIKFIPDKRDMFINLIEWVQSIQQIKNFTYHDILKQIVLLQIHLTDFIKFQSNEDVLFCKDCLQNHLLLVETLTEKVLNKPTAKELNTLVITIRSKLDNLTVDGVTRYIEQIDNIFYEALYNWNIQTDTYPNYEFPNYIQKIDQYRKDFLPAGQCYKCQMGKQEQHL